MGSNESLLKKGEVSHIIFCVCCYIFFICSLDYTDLLVIELPPVKMLFWGHPFST